MYPLQKDRSETELMSNGVGKAHRSPYDASLRSIPQLLPLPPTPLWALLLLPPPLLSALFTHATPSILLSIIKTGRLSVPPVGPRLSLPPWVYRHCHRRARRPNHHPPANSVHLHHEIFKLF